MDSGGDNPNVPLQLKRVESEIGIQVEYECYDQLLLNIAFPDCHSTLERLIVNDRGELSKEFRETVLLQVGYCLLGLEEGADFCSESSLPRNISIWKYMIEKKSDEINACSVDMKKLASIYCYVLTGQELKAKYPKRDDLSEHCDDPDSALDLLRRMNEENFTIKDVLSHPFHWSSREKIDFICDAYKRISLELPPKKSRPKLRPIETEALKKYGIDKDDESMNIIPNTGWIDELELSDDDIEQINHVYQPRSSIPVKTIYDLAFIENKIPKTAAFDEMSIFELIRFFRNNYIHYWEKNKTVQRAFGDCIDGYWGFYSKRFPKLLIYVYKKMKGYMNLQISAFKHLPEN